MSAQTEHDLSVIEALDFEPMCEATSWLGLGCEGRNAAAYLVAQNRCGRLSFMCSDCAAWRIALGCRRWDGDKHGCPPIVAYWLDTVTLHPIGGTS